MQGKYWWVVLEEQTVKARIIGCLSTEQARKIAKHFFPHAARLRVATYHELNKRKQREALAARCLKPEQWANLEALKRPVAAEEEQRTMAAGGER